VSADNTQVTVGGAIGPTSTSDTYPAQQSKYCLGGWHSVDDVTARDAIPAARRVQGMVAVDISTFSAYMLQGGIENIHWVEIDLGFTPTPTAEYFLLEDGFNLLLENGDRLVIESAGTTYPDRFTLEGGDYLLLENGDVLLIE